MTLDETLPGQVQDTKSGSQRAGGGESEEPVAGQKATGVETPLPNESGESADLGELGDYKLLKKIGQGGMGTVYKAIQTRLGKTVALKLLPADRVQDEIAVARFEREMKAVGGLDHPNIVQACDARDIEGTNVLVMEYVEGTGLSAVVERRGPLPIADACEIIRQAASGLHYAHENGLVHRDIKPSNLMLTTKGEVKILDLGLALLNVDPTDGPEMTSTGQAMGTADYMAPEQVFDSHTVDVRADIYSLGCTFYKLLTGRAPFADSEHESHFRKMMAHVKTPIPPIQPKRDVPNALNAVVERMVAKDPDERFPTPGDVVTALERFCEGCDLVNLMTGARPEKSAQAKTEDSVASTAEYASSAHTGTESSHAVEPIAKPASSSRVRKPRTVVALIAVLLGAVVWICRTRTEVPESGDLRATTSGDVHGNVPPSDVLQISNGGSSSTDHDRQAAEWVLQNGGDLQISVSGDTVKPTAVEELPNQSFHITSIAFQESENVTAGELKHLRDLTKLQYLKLQTLKRLRLTDAQMDILVELPDLTGLSLRNVEFEENALGRLKDLEKVFSLTLASIPFTDKDVEHLVAMPRLSLLNLSSTEVADAGLEGLKAADSLDRLLLSGTEITDSGLQHLADMPKLAALDLSWTSITDTGLEQLVQLPQLTELHLAYTAVTDDGLVHLRQMKCLRVLNLQKAKVSAAGVADLQAALPNCVITVEQAIEKALSNP